jgi:hypothetical protein
MTALKSILPGIFGLVLSITAANACALSNVMPGLSGVDTPIKVKPGKGCNVSMDLEGWQIHRITIVEKPRLGTVKVRGNQGYIYRASSRAGDDRFVIEFETTGVDWQSGVALQRTTWRITRPVEIR